ncbi:hypothetical protein HWV23_08745 [Natronomonas halophila]|uniref:hypothetical protein n=1 Tax=Natronomonas halophila TaxID=2747817 RepID=UPI0015B6F9A8|nr:hypothetical protein [Natronomonas halophila]QLD85807.1 hypothetical protein HWV23_08745 [Natronomonas halophila]
MVRALLRSRAAVGCTLLGAAAVGAVAAIGWQLAMVLHASAVSVHPLFLGGLGRLLYLVLLVVVAALVSLVWYPFGAGVAYAVGRQARGGTATLGGTLAAVRNAAVPLARWLKTRVAVGPLAEYVVSEDDVAPNEIVVGCEAFVVPAVVLDSPTSLARGVDRANRVPPEPGRERVVFGGLAVTVLLVVAVAAGGVLSTPLSASLAVSLSVALAVLGLVATVAIDAAWRARAYATAESL